MNNDFGARVTPLFRSPPLSKRIGCAISIKDESAQVTGTLKGRIIQPVFREALSKNADRIAVFWLGNTTQAITWGAQKTGTKVSCFVQPNPSTQLLENLRGKVEFIQGIDFTKEILTEKKMIELSRKQNETVFPVINVFPDYYAPIAREIIEETTPDYIVIPLGSGSLFYGISMGLESSGNTQTKIIGVTLKGKNPFSNTNGSIQKNGKHTFLSNFRHDSIADKIAQPYSGFEPQVKKLIKKGHRIIELDEKEVQKAHQFVNTELNLSSEPSAAIAFGGLEKLSFQETDKIVVINTGNGFRNNIE